MFSPADGILASLFAPGEFLAGRRSEEAVGLRGKPDDGLWTDRFEMFGFGHGHYWGELATAQVIASVLGYYRLRPLIRRMAPIRRSVARRNVGSRQPPELRTESSVLTSGWS